MNRSRMHSIENPVFMIGFPRSGTSILSETIAAHENIGWFSNYVNKFPCQPWLAVLNRMTHGHSWSNVLRGKKHQDKGLKSFLRRYLPYTAEAYSVWKYLVGEKFLWSYLSDETATDDEKKKVISYISYVLRAQNRDRFFTKLTGPPRIKFISSIFPDAKYIHIIRDPRAVVSSLLNVDFWKDRGLDKPYWHDTFFPDYLQEWHAHRFPHIALAAAQWKYVVEQTHHEVGFIDNDNFIEIKYEDFVQSPHSQLSQLFSFLNLPDSKLAHNYISSTGEIINMNYKYKEKLCDEVIKSVENITKNVAENAGYSFS